MSKEKVITAWRLEDGVVVYLGPGRSWVRDLSEAQPHAAEEVENALTWASSRELEKVVVDPYSMPVVGTQPSGRSARERIRARGPTVRPDLGRS